MALRTRIQSDNAKAFTTDQAQRLTSGRFVLVWRGVVWREFELRQRLSELLLSELLPRQRLSELLHCPSYFHELLPESTGSPNGRFGG